MPAATTTLAMCLIIAAQTYSVPPGVLLGIMQVEGGRIGQEVRNTNGSYDMGPMQINTIWLPTLSAKWGIDQSTAKRWVRDDGCTNMAVAAWILRNRINLTGNLWSGIAGYHSLTPGLGSRYAAKVAAVMRRYRLSDRMDQIAVR
jgi:soluble lytic murein transglycosylase-like protein